MPGRPADRSRVYREDPLSGHPVFTIRQVGGRSPRVHMPGDASERRRLRILTVVLVLCLWGLATHSTYGGSGDEPHYLAMAHSLAFDLDLDVANNYGRAEPLIAGGGLDAGPHARPGRDGTIRPIHDIGLPLLLAPYVRVVRPLVVPLLAAPDHAVLRRLRLTPTTAYRHLLSAAMIVVAVVLAQQMFRVFRILGAGPAAAFWTTLLIALSVPLLIYSLLLFTELVSALLALYAFRRVTLEVDRSGLAWTFTGTAIGLLLLVHVRNIGLVVPLALLGAIQLGRQKSVRNAAAFFAALAVPVAVRTAANHVFWGTFVTTPHARGGGWPGLGETLSIGATRLGGMFLDQEFGLLPYAPIFVLALLGGVRLVRTRPLLASQLGAVVGFYLLLICLPSTNPHGWTAGWSPAGRFLTPVVPLLAIAVWTGIATTSRLLLIPVVAVQIAISVYAWQNPKNLWNDGDGVAAVCQRGGATFCRFLPSFDTEQ